MVKMGLPIEIFRAPGDADGAASTIDLGERWRRVAGPVARHKNKLQGKASTLQKRHDVA